MTTREIAPCGTGILPVNHGQDGHATMPNLADMARGYLDFWAGIFRALCRALAWACEARP
jgi:hypothetical protein